MSFFYKLNIQYDGTGYYGWQKQRPVTEKTIQDELERVLTQISGGALLNTIGSGRTDAGVHALTQVVRAEFSRAMDIQVILRGGNSLLSPSIRILSIEEVSEDFHPIFSAKSKEYIYLFTTDRLLSPFLVQRIVQVAEDFDLELMNQACQRLVGEHDFAQYQCVGTPVKTTVREIYSATLELVPEFPLAPEQKVYQLSIVGNGFLKQMVRLIMGAIWQVGRGRVSLEQFEQSLTGMGQTKLGAVAPPHGLYLKEVHY